MSVREDLLQSFRDWAKDVLNLTDSKVVLQQRGGKGPRPSLPFLVLNLRTMDTPIGVDETFFTDLGTIYKGNRQCRLELKTYGDDTDEWLTLLGVKVSQYEGDATLVHQAAPITDISWQANTAEYESAYLKEFLVEYAIQYSDDPAVPAEIVTVTSIANQTLTNVTTVELDS